MAIVPECVPALMASNAPLIVVYDAAPVPPVAMTLTWAEAAVANSKVATMQVARRASRVNRLLANGRIK